MFVLKNRHSPELSEANSYVTLSRSKQLLTNNRHSHRKTYRMTDCTCTHVHQPRRKKSRQNACGHN